MLNYLLVFDPICQKLFEDVQFLIYPKAGQSITLGMRDRHDYFDRAFRYYDKTLHA